MRDYFKRFRCRNKYCRFDCSNRRARSRAKRDLRKILKEI